MLTANQNAEQLARDAIDKLLLASGWPVQSKKQINLQAAKRLVLLKYQNNVGVAATTLTSFYKTVDKNFQDWIFEKQAGTTRDTTEQVQWLKDYIANSFHVDRDDCELDPFNKQGSLGKMWQLFNEEIEAIINLNERLVV